MGFFGLKSLSIEGQCLHGKLRVISCILFVFPCTVVSYIFYQQGLFSRMDSPHILVFLLLLVLACAGIFVLHQAFNKFVMVSVFMKKAEAGEMVMMDLQKDSSELTEISISFNKLIKRLDETGKQLEKLEIELKKSTTERIRAEEALIPLKKAVDIMQLGVTITDTHKKILYTNRADARMHGYEIDELIGKDVRIFAPTDLHKYGEIQEMQTWSRESFNVRKDGTLFPVRLTSDAVTDAEGCCIGTVSTCEDISERKRSEEVLRLRQRVIDASSNGIMITDTKLSNNQIIYVNPAFERLTGYHGQEILGRDMRFLLGEDQGQIGFMEIHEAMSEQREGNAVLRNYRKDGTLFWNDLSISPVRDESGYVTHFVGIINDITEREQHEEQLAYLANHDALTGLPNRNLLADRTTQLLSNALRNNHLVAVLFVDLDNFKLVNDSLGHDLGDRLLQVEAERLHNCTRSSDTVARYGGDEFVIVISMLDRDEDAATVAQNILEVISQPFTIDENELGVSCSIGISIYPKDGSNVETLLKNADAAMYRAKEQGRNTFQFYTVELNDRVVERMNMERHLRRALELGELTVYYQPQVELKTGRLAGVEALLRWRNPDLGVVPPNRFIPLAEETGLIVPIGEWVLKTCCEQNKAWQNAGFTPMTMSVNLSCRQLQKKGLAGVIARILQETGLEPRFLVLEIVESMVMQDVEGATATMNELKGLGVHLAMDDFGTGYSSLSYLKRFPFDKLKIDLSFIRDITTDPESAAITRAIIAMAHNLNLSVIAEGVETESQFEYLRLHSCDEIQGFYFCRPLPARELEQTIRENLMFQVSAGTASLPGADWH